MNLEEIQRWNRIQELDLCWPEPARAAGLEGEDTTRPGKERWMLAALYEIEENTKPGA